MLIEANCLVDQAEKSGHGSLDGEAPPPAQAPGLQTSSSSLSHSNSSFSSQAQAKRPATETTESLETIRLGESSSFKSQARNKGNEDSPSQVSTASSGMKPGPRIRTFATAAKFKALWLATEQRLAAAASTDQAASPIYNNLHPEGAYNNQTPETSSCS
jgi:hypothetical protein